MRHRLLIPILAATLLAPFPALAQNKNKKPDPKPSRPQSVQPEESDPGAATSKQKIDLRPKFHKGETIKFKMELSGKATKFNPALDDKPQPSSFTKEMGLVFKVKDVTDDGTIVELTFSRIKTSEISEGEKQEFDSSQPTSKDKGSEQAPTLRALAGTTFTLTVDKDGNITNIAGGEKLTSLDIFGGGMSSLPGLNPGSLGITPPAGSAPTASMKDALGPVFNIKKGSGTATVGEEWSNVDVLDTGLFGRFKISDKNKLKSYNGSEALINVTGFIEPESTGSDALSLVKIKDSSFVGDYTWNTREGMLRRMNMNQHVVIEAGGAGAGMTADFKNSVTRSN